MKKYALICGMLAATLAFTACGKKAAPVETTAEMKQDDGSNVSKSEMKQDDGGYVSIVGNELYEKLDGIIFGFASGAGAWETYLEVDRNGGFAGQFYDANMGETGEGYENGTIYECSFTGKFSEPKLVKEHVYEAEVVELHYPLTGQDGQASYIDEDNVRHVLTEAYGLSEGAKVHFYEPGMKYADTDENFRQWVFWYFWDNEPEVLEEYAIYNLTNEAGFYPDHYAMGDALSEEEEHADTESDFYLSIKNSYENQAIPEDAMLPCLPTALYQMQAPYESVNLKNLQGSWVNEYKEGSSTIREILTITGEKGKIESYKDGQPTYAWNEEGYAYLEDRSDRNLCPAFRIDNTVDGSNACTIYIRWVKDDRFFDGGFLNEWKRIPDGEYTYLHDTVTLDNLQGVWYSEYADDGGFYQDVLTVDGDQATLIETIDGEVSSFWNHAGTAYVAPARLNYEGPVPELTIDYADGSGSAGIYITDVEDNFFYDLGFSRYWYKVNPWDESWYDDYGDNEYEEASMFYDGDSLLIQGNNIYRITPKGSTAPDGSTNCYKIEATNYSGTKLELDYEVDPYSNYFPGDTGIVSEADVNFDGLMDIILFKGCIGVRSVEIDCCYLNLGDKFVEVEGYEEIGDGFVDEVDRCIHSTVRDSAMSYYMYTYEVQGTKVVETSSTFFEYDEAKDEYVQKN